MKAKGKKGNPREIWGWEQRNLACQCQSSWEERVVFVGCSFPPAQVRFIFPFFSLELLFSSRMRSKAFACFCSGFAGDERPDPRKTGFWAC